MKMKNHMHDDDDDGMVNHHMENCLFCMHVCMCVCFSDSFIINLQLFFAFLSCDETKTNTKGRGRGENGKLFDLISSSVKVNSRV